MLTRAQQGLQQIIQHRFFAGKNIHLRNHAGNDGQSLVLGSQMPIKDLKLGKNYEARAAEIAPAEAQLKACADSILAALFPNSPRAEPETDIGFEHD